MSLWQGSAPNRPLTALHGPLAGLRGGEERNGMEERTPKPKVWLRPWQWHSNSSIHSLRLYYSLFHKTYRKHKKLYAVADDKSKVTWRYNEKG